MESKSKNRIVLHILLPLKLAAPNDFAIYILILAMEGRCLMLKVDKIRFEVKPILPSLKRKTKF